MEADQRTSRVWNRVLLAAAIVTILPLWSAKYLPFADLPEHVATIATLRHWADPTWHNGTTYVLALGKSQYIAYHALGALLAFPLGADLGNRVLLSAVGIAVPYAMRSLLRAFDTDERVAILACPLFWSRPLVLGFLPYVASLPVAFFVLALIVRQRREPTRRRAIAIALLAIVVFYLHLSAFTVLVVVSCTLAAVPVLARSRPRVFAETVLALAPSLVCAAIWAVSADPRGGPMLLASESVRGPARAHLGVLFAAWTHDIWRSHVDEVEGIAFWGLVLWLGSQRGAAEPEGVRGITARLVPFVCALLLFVALPYRLGAGAMLNVRLAALLAFFALLVLRPDPGKRSRLPLALAAVLSVAVSATAIVEIRLAEREIGDFDGVLARVPPGAKLLALHFDRDSAVVQGPAWIHLAAYHRLRRGGVASLSFSEMAHWPIQYRAAARPPQKGKLFWDFEPCAFRNASDGPYYDVILSRGAVDPLGGGPPGPVWRRILTPSPGAPWRLDEKVPETWRPADARDVGGPCR